MRDRKFSILKLLIITIKFLIPLTVITLKFIFPQVKHGWFFVGYIIFLVIERSWETFYSGKFEKNINKIEKDWTFQAVAMIYAIMAFIMIFEFFLVPRQPVLLLFLAGGVIYFLALCLRLWAVKTLGETWQTVTLGRKLITNKGLYQYMRHPVYLGVLLEVLAVPLIPGAYFAFLFSLCIFAPLIILKTYFEERELMNIFAAEYLKYKNERWAFWPFPKKAGE